MAVKKTNTRKTDTVVIGAGQAGLAMSEHLSNNNVDHIVLEKARIAEQWRTGRWDSLVANGPAWHDAFPTMDFKIHPDAFATKDDVTEYFEDFAAKIDAPIKCGVEVQEVRRKSAAAGFEIITSEGVFEAMNIVSATGPFQHPVIPPVIPSDADIQQLHSNSYFNPQQLPEGAVLVVGSGSSGSQIADELLRSGREVYLSVGPHERPPRSYRSRDFVWWLGVLGKWDLATVDPDTAHVTIAVSGAYGGKTVDFREFASRGMNLVGMTQSYNNGVLAFADDLAGNISHGDSSFLNMLAEADAYVERNGLDLPLEEEAKTLVTMPDCVTQPIRELHLQDAGITSVIWATGYRNDFNWLQADIFDHEGKPLHQRGVTAEQGIYFLGLPWLSRRGSSFIWGVWHDAKYIADHIMTQHRYMKYKPVK